MKYFITGATGFIGGSVARLLREAGLPLATVQPGVNYVPGDTGASGCPF
jgi:nucleoside-diphosphate-sugar epimerase